MRPGVRAASALDDERVCMERGLILSGQRGDSGVWLFVVTTDLFKGSRIVERCVMSLRWTQTYIEWHELDTAAPQLADGEDEVA